MPPLEPPDSHFMKAAEGWLELGLRAEAAAELDSISAEHQQHPDVLDLRWALHASEQRWDAALGVARALLASAPDRSAGWLHHAYALRRAADGGLAKAWAALKPAAEQFPAEPIIPFNLACYACQLGQLAEARAWLRRAFALGGKDRMKLMALLDEDLEPLWQEIREL